MSAPAPEPARPLREFEAHFTLARFVVVTAVLLFLLFPGLCLGTRTFVFRDYGLYSFPIAHHLRESLHAGEIPLWNPASNCGIPFLAEWSTMALYPPAMFFVVLPLTWALGMFMMLHLVWAGAGMFVLGRRWTGSGIAAAFAGLVFTFNGLTTNCLMWPYYVAALSWTPWVLLTVERAWREGGRHIAFASLAGAMQMVVGIPEVIAPTWLIAGSLALADLQRSKFQFQSSKLLLLRFASVVLLVTALAAPQLFPFLDFISHSQRTTDYATSDWSLPATGWANLLVPLFRCYESPSGVFFQVNQGITSSYYVGILTLVLAVAGIRAGFGAGSAVSSGLAHETESQASRSHILVLAALAIAGLVLALGDHTPVYPMLRKLFPALGVMRYPVKFMFLTMMVLPWLAAVGLGAVLAAPRETLARAGRVVIFLGATGLLGIIAIVCLSHFSPIEGEVPEAVLRNGLARGTLLVLAAALLVGFLRAITRDRQRVCLLGFLLFTWTDLATHLPLQNPTAEPAVLQPRIPLVQALTPAPKPGHGRAMLTPAAFMEFHQKGLADPAKTLLLQRVGMYDNCNLLEGLAKVDGFFSLHIGWERAVQPAIFLSTNRINQAMADFLGVTHVTSPTNIFQWDTRPTALPLMTAGQRPLFANWAVTVNGMAATNFDSREIVFLPPEAHRAVTATNRARATVANYQFRAHRIEADVTADLPALVVIAQTWYHPWRAYVNDKPTPLWRANHAYQAFEVPAGTSRVRVVYEDRAFRLGVVLAAAALVGCVAVLVASRLRRNDE